MKTNVLLNSVTGTGLYIVNILVSFIMSPFLVHTLGNSNYGIWEVILSIVGYMGIMDLGVGPALVRFVSVAHSKGDRRELVQIVSSANMFFLVLGGVAAALLAIVSIFPESLFSSSSHSSGYITTILLLFSINVGLQFPLTVFTGTLMGLQRHYLLNISRVVLTICKAFAVFFILTKYPSSGLVALVIIEGVGNLVQLLLFGGAVYYDKEIPRISFKSCSMSTMRELWTFGLKNMVMMISSRLQIQSMPIIIGSVLGLDKIVYFVMPRRLVEYARGLSTSIGFPLTPYFASFYGKDDQRSLRESWLKTSLALHIVSGAMPIVLLFCGVPFIYRWLGAEYADAGRWVLYFMLIGLVVESFSPNAFRMLTAANRHGRAAYIWLAISLASLPLAVAAAKIWGLPGVALVCSAATVAGTIISLVQACAAVSVEFYQYVKITMLPLVVPLMILASLLWGSGNLLPEYGYLQIVLQLLIGGFGYLIAVWFLVLDRAIRAKVLLKLGHVVGNS